MQVIALSNTMMGIHVVFRPLIEVFIREEELSVHCSIASRLLFGRCAFIFSLYWLPLTVSFTLFAVGS